MARSPRRPAYRPNLSDTGRKNVLDQRRRMFLKATTFGLAAGGFGMEPMAFAASTSPGGGTDGQRRAAGFAGKKKIEAGVLNVAYVEEGPADGKPVLLLHGWPYDIHSFVEVAPILARQDFRVIIPDLRGYGDTHFLKSDAPRNGQQAALAADAIALLDALKIEQAVIGGFDWGARTVNIMAALHPERCRAMVSVSGYLIGSQAGNEVPLPPKAELKWWYQYYFATERGEAGYAKYTHDFARLIWELASPAWTFDDATFARSAASLDNPDHVAVAIDNYRWRLGLTKGEARFDADEKRLATAPAIAVPTITMEGDANGAPHPEPAAYAHKFTGRYEHRLVKGGIGHNLPQEAPRAFAQAIIDADRLA